MTDSTPFTAALALLDEGLAPELVWGLLPRIVGALFVIAFGSFVPQVLGLVGSRGIAPVREQLAAARLHYPSWLRFVRFPSLFWLSASDRAVLWLPRLGVLCGLYAVIGGPGAWWALCFCWLAWLSLDCAWLMPPWDCLMMEAGFFALFLPEPRALPELTAASLPLPIVMFAWRMLLVRLMWGFAKTKFVGNKPGDSMYLRGFLATVPLNTPFGMWLQQAPAFALRGGLAFMAFAEIVCPGLALFSGAPRAIAALGLVGLQVGIFATGNWGLFNVSYGALCIVLLDTHASLAGMTWASIVSSPYTLAVHAALGVLLLGALLYFPLNNWLTFTVPQWEFVRRVPVLGWLIRFYRALMPLRLIHAFGAFPPNSAPPVKLTVVFEGSRDGLTWQEYEYRHLSSNDASRPAWIAPHNPRLDSISGYVAGSVSEGDYLCGLVGAGKIIGFTPFSRYSWIPRVAERLLEGEPSVLALLGHNPFPDQPPKFVRMRLRGLIPRSLPERRRTGLFWQARELGVLFPARERSELVYRHWLPPPELTHPEFLHWRHKSFALRAMLAAYAAGTAHDQAVRAESDLEPEEVARFWREFVPQIAATRGDFSAVDQAASELHARFGTEAVLRFERIAERYAHLLRAQLEPYFYGPATPRIPKRSNFRFHLLLHELILDGRAEFEATLRDPGRVAQRTEQQTAETELHFIGVVRNETIRYHSRMLRAYDQITKVFDRNLPGILEFRVLLRAYVPPDEGVLPAFQQSESGDWTTGPLAAPSGVGAEA